jgi:hypothetical protein
VARPAPGRAQRRSVQGPAGVCSSAASTPSWRAVSTSSSA